MKIFIFETSPDWQYCGGGMAILAESFEEAEDTWKKWQESHDFQSITSLLKERTIIPKDAEPIEVYRLQEYWLLKAEYELDRSYLNLESSVIMMSMNNS
jgi:hypothetical protein